MSSHVNNSFKLNKIQDLEGRVITSLSTLIETEIKTGKARMPDCTKSSVLMCLLMGVVFKQTSRIMIAPGIVCVVCGLGAKCTVSVVGDFNSWSIDTHPLKMREDGSGTVVGKGLYLAFYFYLVRPINIALNRVTMRIVRIRRSLCFFWEVPPKTASRIWELNYD